MKCLADPTGSSAPAAAMRSWVDEVLAACADDMDDARLIPEHLIAEMGRRGLLGLSVSAEFGGSALSPRDLGEVCEALGHASCSALSLVTVQSMVCDAIERWGAAHQKDRWLGDLALGRAIGALALSEKECGSDVESVQTKIAVDGADYVLDGEKTWISFGQRADLFLTIGKLDGAIAALLVSRDTAGVTVEPVEGMAGFQAGMLATVSFDGCRIPQAMLIGSQRMGLAQIVGSVLDRGRYCIAWGSAGLARACLEASVRYTAGRVQFGEAIARFQMVQRMIADMVVGMRTARLMCLDAAAARTARSPDMIMRTSAAKYHAARSADAAASSAVQLHGAAGLMVRSPVQRFLRDAKVMNIIEGSAQIHQQLIGQYADVWANQVEEFL